MALPPPILFDASQHSHLLPQIARIHIDCVLEDGVCLTFLPPLSKAGDESGPDARVLEFWRGQFDEIRQGKRFMVMQLVEGGEEVAGYAMLRTAHAETGPFRGEVEKLCVSPAHRRKGVAARVMEALEVEAKARGRTLIMLDTTVGYPAAQMYPKLGYKLVGRVPDYAISPKTGERLDELWFYKDLR